MKHEGVDDEYHLLFKVVLIGDSGVGKSNILTRFTKNRFNPDSKATLGVEFDTKNMRFEDHTIRVQIWDTAGQERFRAITSNYYKGAMGALLVFDVTKPITFRNVERWLSEVKTNAAENIVVMLIGNKSDLRSTGATEEVRLEDVTEFVTANNIAYLETSAKEDTNIKEAFERLGKEIYEKVKLELEEEEVEEEEDENTSQNGDQQPPPPQIMQEAPKPPPQKPAMSLQKTDAISLDKPKEPANQPPKKEGCCS